MEVDMRSREKEGRTVHMFVDKKQSPLYFYGVPESVKIGLFFREPASIECESFEELEESSVVEVEVHLKESKCWVRKKKMTE